MEKPIFSARVFQNAKLPEERLTPSKIFRKKYEGAVVSILTNYSPDYEDGMSNDEVLAAHGILSYAQTLEWKGPLVYSMEGDADAHAGVEIDTSQNLYGTIINAKTLEHASPLRLPNVKQVIIIENKANYEKQKYKRDTLYIFCHGFFSPKEVRFLKKIVDVAGDNVEYYHWGDMDYGGIRIFQFNKANIFLELQPFKMLKRDYERAVAQGAGVSIEAGKRKKLELLKAGDLEELKQCILEYGLEIEQELLVE